MEKKAKFVINRSSVYAALIFPAPLLSLLFTIKTKVACIVIVNNKWSK